MTFQRKNVNFWDFLAQIFQIQAILGAKIDFLVVLKAQEFRFWQLRKCLKLFWKGTFLGIWSHCAIVVCSSHQIILFKDGVSFAKPSDYNIFLRYYSLKGI